MWHILAQFSRNLAEVRKQTGQVLNTPLDEFTEEEERDKKDGAMPKKTKNTGYSTNADEMRDIISLSLYVLG